MRYLLFLLVGLFIINCSNPTIDEPTKMPAKLVANTAPKAIKTMNEPLYVSYDFGITWEVIGEKLPDSVGISQLERLGNYEGMAAVNNYLLVATMNDGLFMAPEGTENWEQIGEGLPSKQINRLHIDGDEIFVGIFEHGIFKTSDKGENWTKLTYDLPNLRIQSMTTIDGQMLAGTDVGIFKLAKNQKNWKKVFDGLQINSLDEQEGKLLAGTRKGAILSKDKGETWEWIYQNSNANKAIVLDDKIAVTHFAGDLTFSKNWGKTWEDTYYFPKGKAFVNRIVQIDNFMLMSNDRGIYRSTDDGATWLLLHPVDPMTWLADFLVSGKMIYVGAGMGGGC